MKIEVVKNFRDKLNQDKEVKEGEVIARDDMRAKELIELGYAKEIEEVEQAIIEVETETAVKKNTRKKTNAKK